MLENSYGVIRYFESRRCFNDGKLRAFNKGLITASELVSFDCALLHTMEITYDSFPTLTDAKQQILAVIIRPEIEFNARLEHDARFEFCGYDLVEDSTGISAITNCGAEFKKAIAYENLNPFGLLSTYKEAVLTQLHLYENYLDEHHAYCDVVEIWRYCIST